MIRASSLGQSVGFCTGNLSQIASIVNEAQERLMMDPMCPEEGWWGMWGTMAFNVQVINGNRGYAYFTAPFDVARVIVLDVCKVPVQIKNGFYEYLDFGAGLQPKICPKQACGTTLYAYERDTVATLSDLLGDPQYIRIYPTDNADVGKRITIQGEDQNGKMVLGTDIATQQAISGELLYLNFPFTTSAFQYSKITGFLKDLTNGPVQIFQVDAATGNEVPLSSMQTNEVTAQYRRYLLNGLPAHCCSTPNGVVQVTCQVRFDYIPAMSDTDYLVIQNVPALIEECQSIRYSRQDTAAAAKLADGHHLKALSLLCGQLDAYEGKVSTAVKVPIFGSDRLRAQPV